MTTEPRQEAGPQAEAQDVVNRVIGPSIRVKELGDDLNAGLPPSLFEREQEEHGRWCEVAQERERALVDALAAAIEVEREANDGWQTTAEAQLSRALSALREGHTHA